MGLVVKAIVDGEGFDFGDEDLDDAYAEGDDLVSWDQVERLANKFAAIDAIEDDTERLQAAQAETRALVPGGPLTASYDKNLWLHTLPAEAAKRGLQIDTYPGWELLSRSSGGFDDILGICMHHTASVTAPANDMGWQWRNSPIRPIGNISLHRDGKIVLGAAGASNTQGKGGPYTCSKGYIPQDTANKYMIAIEACNAGTGEVWPKAQMDSYERLVEVLCDIYKLQPDPDVVLHHTWAPTRKIDPAGPTPSVPTWGGTSGARTWDLRSVRTSVSQSNPPPPTTMSSFQFTDPVRIVDTRSGTTHNPNVKGNIPSGQVVSVKPHGYTPADADGVILTLTGLGSTYGFFTLWSGNGNAPTASNLNMVPGGYPNNMAWTLLKGGTLKVLSGGAGANNGLVIDQVGWFFT